jgi:YfiH family protein
MSELEPALITIARFNQIPFLRHGFGDAGWMGKDFKKQEGWKDFRLLSLNQVHSDIVHFIDKVPAGSQRGDALITRLPGVLLAVKTADCLPVLLVDEAGRVIAAVHCGWKGTLRGLLERVVQGMKARYACDSASILAAFGPCISSRCYEVGPEVRRSYVAAGFPTSLFQPVPGRPGKYYFDLAAANRLQLLRQGIKPKNIFTVNICTHCDARYPSYRRDKDATGRILSFIGLMS